MIVNFLTILPKNVQGCEQWLVQSPNQDTSKMWHGDHYEKKNERKNILYSNPGISYSITLNFS